MKFWNILSQINNKIGYKYQIIDASTICNTSNIINSSPGGFDVFYVFKDISKDYYFATSYQVYQAMVDAGKTVYLITNNFDYYNTLKSANKQNLLFFFGFEFPTNMQSYTLAGENYKKIINTADLIVANHPFYIHSLNNVKLQFDNAYAYALSSGHKITIPYITKTVKESSNTPTPFDLIYEHADKNDIVSEYPEVQIYDNVLAILGTNNILFYKPVSSINDLFTYIYEPFLIHIISDLNHNDVEIFMDISFKSTAFYNWLMTIGAFNSQQDLTNNMFKFKFNTNVLDEYSFNGVNKNKFVNFLDNPLLNVDKYANAIEYRITDL